MTGRRRTVAGRSQDGRVSPTTAASRADRTRSKFAARYAAAQTEPQRLAAAYDYARAAEAAAVREGVPGASQALASARRKLTEVGDTLTKGLAKRRGRAT